MSLDIRHLIRVERAAQGEKVRVNGKGQKPELEDGLGVGLLMVRCVQKQLERTHEARLRRKS